jgi:hypothetical protein
MTRLRSPSPTPLGLWEALKPTLSLDPDRLPDPLEEPGRNDVLICGPSRSGTTLMAAMLFQPPIAVSVMEPWDALRLPPAQLFASLRAELRAGTLRRGHLDVAALRADGVVLARTDAEPEVPVSLEGADYILAVKCPAFWRYLDRLAHTRFIVCLRDPFEVVASFQHSPGRLAAGLDYEVPFNQAMNHELSQATEDLERRRVMLYDYVNHRLLPHLDRPEVFVVRYERWFTEPAALLSELGTFLDADLSRPLARIRPRGPDPVPSSADERQGALVRECCRTAAALGYPLSPSTAPADRLTAPTG